MQGPGNKTVTLKSVTKLEEVGFQRSGLSSGKEQAAERAPKEGPSHQILQMTLN